MPPDHRPTKLMHCDLNWSLGLQPDLFDISREGTELVHRAAAPHDWAFVDPQEYFDWHMDFGTNVMYCQAYIFGGTALYPSRLGPVAPGPGVDLFPRLYDLARNRGVPTWSYFCVGGDLVMSNHRDDWVVPGSRGYVVDHQQPPFAYGFLAPESGWTDLLCARVTEFLTMYPVDWVLFDWFGYGGLKPNDDPVIPAQYVREPFKRLLGRDMPYAVGDITATEAMRYKRAVLAEQFYRIRDAAKAASPDTKIIFNVPYWREHEEIWTDHPMLNESDGLFAESSRPEVVDWLLSVSKPDQRVMTTLLGRQEDGECDPNTWREWYAKGCDFFGYAWGVPPDFRPHPRYDKDLEIVRAAFAEMP